MKRFLETVQKQIGVLISVFGLAVSFVNLLNGMLSGQETLLQAFSDFYVWSILLVIIPFIISALVESSLLKKFQILMFILVGTLNILTAFQEFYGPVMFLAAWLVMRQYGYLEKHGLAKNLAFLVAVTGLSQISASLFTEDGVYAGFATLLFTIFLVTLLVILWRDLVRQQQQLKSENFTLKMDYRRLSEQLRQLEEDHKPYDLKAVNISPAEERVIKTLTIYKASNREIAERLSIAESTVKLHMYNICNKIGVDNRFAIIDLCKYNFEKELVSELV